MESHQINKNDFLKNVFENQSIIFKIVNLYANSTDDRADLKQEILYNLWKAYPNFKGLSKFSTWMYRISINTAISGIRKSKKHPIIEALSSENIIEEPITEVDFLDEQVNELYKAISKLNDIDRALILLYLEKKSYQEIGEIIGISEKNVSVKLVRIKNKLKQIIKKTFNE